jgi:heme exporter protein B
MSALLSGAGAVFARDVKLSFRSGGGWFYGIFFFAIFAALAAIVFGPELSVLKTAAPAVIWLAAAFALQFAAGGAFENDFADGSLRAIAAEQSGLFSYWLGKAGAVAATAAAPLVVVSPFILVMLGVPFEAGLGAALLFILGLPALVMIALLTSALATGLRAGGLLATIIAAPFAAPVLIFGVGATEILFKSGNLFPPESLILTALSLFMTALVPGFTIAALRLSLE